MVGRKSAMEFLRVTEDLNYRNIILSMVVRQSAGNGTGLPPAHSYHAGPAGSLYPLHLGVAEAGDGEDSPYQVGYLSVSAPCWGGIGDTIRVSLTRRSPVRIAGMYATLVKRYTTARNIHRFRR